MKMKFTYHLLFIFLLLSGTPSHAQSDDGYKESYLTEDLEIYDYDKNHWETLVKDLDYSEDVIQDKKQEKKNYNRSTPPPSNTDIDFDFMKFFLRALLVIAAIAILVFIISNFLGLKTTIRPRNKKIIATTDEDINIENIEEHIHESDLDSFINKAVRQENYSMAVRLYYLAIIKELSNKKLILWKKNKTNRNYISELTASKFQEPFANATLIYEKAWYGNQKIGALEYEQLKPKFNQIIQSINTAVS